MPLAAAQRGGYTAAPAGYPHLQGNLPACAASIALGFFSPQTGGCLAPEAAGGGGVLCRCGTNLNLNPNTLRQVVPLTPSAGVIEWVADSLPLSEWLFSRGGSDPPRAHDRYGVGDKPWSWCNQTMVAVAPTQTRLVVPLAEQRAAFDTVCAAFRPVMHHFFLEIASSPADWFERRLAYSRRCDRERARGMCPAPRRTAGCVCFCRRHWALPVRPVQ